MSANKEENFYGETIEGNQENEQIMSEGTVETNLDVVTPSTLLQDKRRTRTKSVGRPPTQDFLKSRVVQINPSIDSSDNETENKEVAMVSQKKVNLETETVKKATFQSTIVSKMSTHTYASAWQNITLKKATIPTKQNQENTTPPWMKEIRERKSHKMSLRGDEFPDVQERERYTVVEVNFSEPKNKPKESISKKIDNNENDAIKIAEKQTTKSKDINEAIKEILITAPPRKSRRHTVNTDLEDIIVTPQKSNTKNEEIDSNKTLESYFEISQSIDSRSSNKNDSVTNSESFVANSLSIDGWSKNQNSNTGLEKFSLISQSIDDTSKIQKNDCNITNLESSLQTSQNIHSGIKNEENTNLEDLLKPTSDAPVDDKIKTKFNHLEPALERVTDYIARSKKFQKKMQKDIRSLEESLNDQFEKEMQKLREIESMLSLLNKKN